MNLSTRTRAAVAALVMIEGLIVLSVLGLHGNLGLGTVASTLGFMVMSAVVAGALLRGTSH